MNLTHLGLLPNMGCALTTQAEQPRSWGIPAHSWPRSEICPRKSPADAQGPKPAWPSEELAVAQGAGQNKDLPAR